MPPSGLGGTSTHTNKTTSLCEKLRRVGEAGKSSGGREAKAKPLSGYWSTGAVSSVGLLMQGGLKCLYSLECYKVGCREDLAVKGTERA